METKSARTKLLVRVRKWHKDALGYSICQSDNGHAWLQGPMPIPAASHLKKGCFPEKKSHTLPATVDIHPCRPACPKLPISRQRTCTFLWLFELSAICHSKPCTHFILIILEDSPFGTDRGIMKTRLN